MNQQIYQVCVHSPTSEKMEVIGFCNSESLIKDSIKNVVTNFIIHTEGKNKLASVFIPYNCNLEGDNITDGYYVKDYNDIIVIFEKKSLINITSGYLYGYNIKKKIDIQKLRTFTIIKIDVAIFNEEINIGENGFDSNFMDNLEQAVFNITKSVTTILSNSIYVEEKNDDTVQLFNSACENGNIDTVKKLIDNDLVTSHINSGLITACKYGHNKIINFLLLLKATNPTIWNNYALYIACEMGHYNCVKILLNHEKVSTPIPLIKLMNKLCEKQYHNIIRLLLDSDKIIISDEHINILEYACKNNNNECVKLYLQSGKINPGINDSYCLVIALENDNDDLVQILVKDGRVNVNIAFVTAAKLGYIKTINKLLVTEVVNPYFNNNAAIIAAVFNYQYDVVEKLLEDDRICPVVENNKALMICCVMTNLRMTKILLNNVQVVENIKRDYTRFIEAVEKTDNCFISDFKKLFEEKCKNI